MSDLFGITRTVVNPRYALITPDGFVPSAVPGWKDSVVVVNISPAMVGPRFTQLQVTLGKEGTGEGKMGVFAACCLRQRLPGFHRNLTIGFRRQHRDGFRSVDVSDNAGQSLVGAIKMHPVQCLEVLDLMGTGNYKSEAVDDAGHRALIDAAKASGVKHFVYTSAQGTREDHPTDFYRTKFQVEKYLKASGLSYTILRPPSFMEWHVHNLLGADFLKAGKATIYGAGNNPVNFMAGQEVAHIAVIA